MAQDHRIIANGRRINFSCQNKRFRTDVLRGFRHRPSATRGSVVPNPLIRSDGFSLWLEHLVEFQPSGADWYWLMWYAPDGRPTIPLSGVFKRSELAGMVEQLLQLEPRFSRRHLVEVG